jgi:plastocyanin
MNKTTGIILAALVLGVGLVWFMSSDSNLDGTTNEQNITEQSTGGASSSEDSTSGSGSNADGVRNYNGLTPGETDAQGRVAVLYTGSGFYPSQLTIDAGTEVRFINLDNLAMRVEGIAYEGGEILPDFLAPDALGYGGDYTFTFTKMGIWGYRNSLAKENIGTVIVTEQR